jgi:hypothetical protein
MATTMRMLVLGLTMAALAACAPPGGGVVRGKSGSTTDTATVPAGGKWSKSWPVTGTYDASTSWAAGSHPVNVYLMTDTEWAKWQAGANPESLNVLGKKLGAATGEVTVTTTAGTTIVLIFENPSNTPVELQWWGSFGPRR